MLKASLAYNIGKLFAQKKNSIEGMRGVYKFIKSSVEDACSGEGISIYEKLITCGKLLPQDLSDQIPRENLRGRRAMDVYEGRLDPFVRAQLFLSLMAEIEDMIGELLRGILRSFPQKIAQKNIPLQETLATRDLSKSIENTIDAELAVVFYGGPKKLLEYIREILSGPSLLTAEWPVYLEMRARRDIGLHAGWKSNRIYLEKAGQRAVLGDGISLYPNEEYFMQAYDHALDICNVLESHCRTKFSRCTKQYVFREMWDSSPLLSIMTYDMAWHDGETPAPKDYGVEWHWSGSEKSYYDFFLHIHSWSNPFNVSMLLEKWPGSDSRIVREWLDNPFFF